MKIDNISRQMQQKETIYTFLQGIYEKEISSKVLAEMAAKMQPLKGIVGNFSNTETKTTVQEFLRFIDSIPAQDKSHLETVLAADYARLFLSLNKVPAHPSESTYREGTMMQHHRDEVLQTYWSFGVSAKKDFTEPEDHIATELSFMAFLCRQAGEALNRDDIQEAKRFTLAQKEFLETHILKWFPSLIRDILQLSTTPFYKGIAAFTGEFIEMDLSLTEQTLAQLN
jgi:TorA maturation chaperone TorD